MSMFEDALTEIYTLQHISTVYTDPEKKRIFELEKGIIYHMKGFET